MKILVLYDSDYGNTAVVATAIRTALSAEHEVKQKSIKESIPPDLTANDLVIFGSPTQGGKPTKAMEAWINELPTLKHLPVAVFDTRFYAKEQGFALRALMKVIGYAADKMAETLHTKGATVVSEPEGFIVTDKKGPLKDGELARVHEWAFGLVASIPQNNSA